MQASVAAVVLGGRQQSAEAPPHRPPASPLAQVEAVGRALPRAPIPADLLARQALHDAAVEAAAAAGPAAPDCLEACCLRDDLHLFMPAGPTRSLLTWARLPLPLLYEGGQFSYPLRQVGLPAPLLQLALNRRASVGWDSCLWHTNLPMLAARSGEQLEYAVTLLQLAPGAENASDEPKQLQQARVRSPVEEGGGSDDDDSEAGQGSSEEWEDDGGGFNLRRLCVVGTRSPTAHTCWQRHLTQQPLLLLDDGTLLEVQLQQGVQVVEAWRPPTGAVPTCLRGALQVAGGAQPRNALLALRNRLSRLDLRSSGGTLSLLWQCPQGQHLTAICAAPAAGNGPGGGSAAEHLLAAATGSGAQSSGARVLLFDLRRPGQPVAAWDQPRLGEQGFEAGTLLRWSPTTAPAASFAGRSSRQQQRPEGGELQRGGLLVAGSSGGGQVVGCQFVEQAVGPALQARGGQIQERPAGAAALLLERLQASLEEQQQERQAQQAEGSGTGAPPQAAQAASVPLPLQPPPALPLAPQLLWQPAHSCTLTPMPPGTPVLLQPPTDQRLALHRWVEAGRLRMQKLGAATGVAMQFERASERQQHSHQLAGLAAVEADWATGQELPVPLLCSLTRQGDVLLALLRGGQSEEAGQQAASAAAAPPLLVPVGQGPPDGAGTSRDEQQSKPEAAAGTRLLPYVRGVPRAVVAAVSDGMLEACGCCKECLSRHSHGCATRVALRQAGLLKRTGEQNGHYQAVATVPAGDSERSIVQLPLHTALAQRLVQENAEPLGHPPGQPEQQRTAAELDNILLRLRRSCISFHELQASLQLQLPAEGTHAQSSSSSDGEGEARALSTVRRAQQAARQQVRREWRQRRLQERNALRDAQQAALAALLEGSLSSGSAADGSRPGQAGRQAPQRHSGRGKQSAAAAAGQHLTPSTAALEAVLQRARLLPQRPPSGPEGEQQSWLQQQPQHEQQQQHASGQPSELLPAGLPAPFREQLAAALHRPAAHAAAAAATAAAATGGGSGQPEGEPSDRPRWQVVPRSFVLFPAPDGQQPPAALRLEVQRAAAAADVLLLTRHVHEEGGASTSAAAAERGSSGAPAPWLCLRAPDPPVADDASALLAELRVAWA